MRWITGGPIPGRKFLFDWAARPVLRVAGSVLGSDLLERVGEFLVDLRTTYDGVAQRGREIEAILGEASILVVTTSDPAPVTEAMRFFRELPGLASAPSSVVFNRILPSDWAHVEIPTSTSPELTHNMERWSAETVRQQDTREEFSARYGAHVATIPWSPSSPTDIDGLAGLLDESTGIPWGDIGVSAPA